MKKELEKIRNIAIIGHGGAGKTSLSDAFLFDAGVLIVLARWMMKRHYSTLNRRRLKGESLSTLPSIIMNGISIK